MHCREQGLGDKELGHAHCTCKAWLRPCMACMQGHGRETREGSGTGAKDIGALGMRMHKQGHGREARRGMARLRKHGA